MRATVTPATPPVRPKMGIAPTYGKLPALLATPPAVLTDAVKTALASVVSACLQRRPGYDALSGALRPEHTPTTESEEAPCTLPAGHQGGHSDCLGRAWTNAPAPAEAPEKPTALTAAQRILVSDRELGAGVTAPIESAIRDIDDCCTPRENDEWPFLAAQMVVSDELPQAYGRHTEIWLHYGRSTGSLTPAKARQVLTAMRDFTEQLAALVDLAEETAAGDFDGDPEIARLDTEATDRRIKAINAASE
jgi:hypothetical protein